MRIAFLLLLTLTACGPKTPSPERSSDRMLITRDQIERLNVPDIYEVVRRLRPEYLRERQVSTSERVFAIVYINGMRTGTPGVLRNVRSGEVEQIRFVNAIDATTRYGTGHNGGVIEVTTRQGVRR